MGQIMVYAGAGLVLLGAVLFVWTVAAGGKRRKKLQDAIENEY